MINKKIKKLLSELMDGIVFLPLHSNNIERVERVERVKRVWVGKIKNIKEKKKDYR